MGLHKASVTLPIRSKLYPCGPPPHPRGPSSSPEFVAAAIMALQLQTAEHWSCLSGVLRSSGPAPPSRSPAPRTHVLPPFASAHEIHTHTYTHVRAGSEAPATIPRTPLPDTDSSGTPFIGEKLLLYKRKPRLWYSGPNLGRGACPKLRLASWEVVRGLWPSIHPEVPSCPEAPGACPWPSRVSAPSASSVRGVQPGPSPCPAASCQEAPFCPSVSA